MLSTLQSTRTWVVAAFSLVLIVPVDALAQQSVLRLRLNGPVHEAPIPDAELMVLLGGEKSTTLRTLVDQIHEAAEDRRPRNGGHGRQPRGRGRGGAYRRPA